MLFDIGNVIKIISFYFLFISVEVYADDIDSIIQNYKTQINEIIQNSNEYTLDVDASRYKPLTDDITEFGEFDYIVIGAGATGAVVANSLSEDANKTVLLLEAGKLPSFITDMPGLVHQTALSDYNWGFQTIPQKNGCLGMVDRKCSCSRGRGLGGSTLINAIMYSRANARDFDRLAKEVKNDAWSYKNVLKYFKKGENFTHTNPKAPYEPYFHGKNGYLNVENNLIDNPRSRAFVHAFSELGYKFIDYSSSDEEGVSMMQTMKKGGQRADTGTAFILPILDRKNLNVSLESYVIKIEIDPETKIAQSVLFTKNGTLYRGKAKNEIILSAGSFQSPQILQLSGVGKKEDLDKFNISLISDLNVGKNLQDQNTIFLSLTHNTTDPVIDLDTAIREYLQDEGILTATIEGISFIDSNRKNYPDMELFVSPFAHNPIPGLSNKLSNYNNQTSMELSVGSNLTTFIIETVHLFSKSKGSVYLKSDSPYDYPLIDYNILSEINDLEMLYKTVQLTRQLTKTNAFKAINAKIVPHFLTACKDYELDSKEYWFCNFRQLTRSIYHPLGTCSMGKNPKGGAVVDSKLRVFGVKKLRVADGSVFPFNMRSHMVANCIVVGQIIADFIKKDNC